MNFHDMNAQNMSISGEKTAGKIFIDIKLDILDNRIDEPMIVEFIIVSESIYFQPEANI